MLQRCLYDGQGSHAGLLHCTCNVGYPGGKQPTRRPILSPAQLHADTGSRTGVGAAALPGAAPSLPTHSRAMLSGASPPRPCTRGVWGGRSEAAGAGTALPATVIRRGEAAGAAAVAGCAAPAGAAGGAATEAPTGAHVATTCAAFSSLGADAAAAVDPAAPETPALGRDLGRDELRNSDACRGQRGG